MTKTEKKAARKERKIEARKFQAPKKGQWLSNASMQDASKIKRTFPQVFEGTPRAHASWSVEDLVKEGIVGLYSQHGVS